MSTTLLESSPLLLQDFSRNPIAGKLGTRHAQVFLLFVGIAISFGERNCLPVAIVAMTDAKSANPNFPDFDWDTKKSSMILSSFFWGYIVSQVPSGYIASTRSAHKLLSCGVLLSSFFLMFIPLLAIRYGWVAVICCRVVVGLMQGCVLPCIQTILSKWAPPIERAKLGSFLMNGGTLGTVITMSLSGVLCTSRLGWPSVFYIFGFFGIVWAVLFYYMGADTPSEHPTISPHEVRYINASLGRTSSINLQKPPVPWFSIFTSVPLWSLVIVHSGANWGSYTLLTEMPTYMKFILNFDAQQSGIVSAVPFLAMWIMGFPISWFSDYALKRGVSAGYIRKVSNTIGLWLPALALLVLCSLRSKNNVMLSMILVLTLGFNAGVSSGFQINHIDLSPNFAGTLMSITNCVGNVFSVLAPLACGAIVEDPSNENQWKTVFYITASVYFFTNLIFIVFGKAEPQPWNDTDQTLKDFAVVDST